MVDLPKPCRLEEYCIGISKEVIEIVLRLIFISKFRCATQGVFLQWAMDRGQVTNESVSICLDKFLSIFTLSAGTEALYPIIKTMIFFLKNQSHIPCDSNLRLRNFLHFE